MRPRRGSFRCVLAEGLSVTPFQKRRKSPSFKLQMNLQDDNISLQPSISSSEGWSVSVLSFPIGLVPFAKPEPGHHLLVAI